MQLERLVLVNGRLVSNQLSIWGEWGHLHLLIAIILFISFKFIVTKEFFPPPSLSSPVLMYYSAHLLNRNRALAFLIPSITCRVFRKQKSDR